MQHGLRGETGGNEGSCMLEFSIPPDPADSERCRAGRHGRTRTDTDGHGRTRTESPCTGGAGSRGFPRIPVDSRGFPWIPVDSGGFRRGGLRVSTPFTGSTPSTPVHAQCGGKRGIIRAIARWEISAADRSETVAKWRKVEESGGKWRILEDYDEYLCSCNSSSPGGSTR
jgi:hypothetical protein